MVPQSIRQSSQDTLAKGFSARTVLKFTAGSATDGLLASMRVYRHLRCSCARCGVRGTCASGCDDRGSASDDRQNVTTNFGVRHENGDLRTSADGCDQLVDDWSRDLSLREGTTGSSSAQ